MAKHDKAPEHFPDFDAQTLADAAAIKADPKRLMNAKIAAAQMAEEQMTKARTMRTLARGVAKKKR